jgi:hypothetical protein
LRLQCNSISDKLGARVHVDLTLPAVPAHLRAGHAAAFAVTVDATRLEGELTFYDMQADSGNTARSGVCGTFSSFRAASLDDPSLFKPEMVVFEDAKLPWDHVDPMLRRP